MEVSVENGVSARAMVPTNTLQGLTKMYVDSRAASALSDGSAQLPFRTIESALRLLPDDAALTPEGLLEMRVLECTGIFDGVTVDKSCAITGLCGIYNLAVTEPEFFIMQGGLIKNALFGGLGSEQNITLMDLSDTDDSTLTLDSCNFSVSNATLQSTYAFAAESTGSIWMVNCVITTTWELPLGWTLYAHNSYINVTGAGTIILRNSVNTA